MICDTDQPEQVLRQMERTHICRCGGTLAVAWGGAFGYNGWVLRCTQDPAHRDFERPYIPTQGNNPDLPGWKLSKNRRRHLQEQVGIERSQKLMKYQGVVSLTKQDAREIITTIWPNAEKASPAEVFKAIAICSQYGLNPLMNHLHLIPFDKKDAKGNVIKTEYVAVKGINANRLIASRKHRYSYIDNTPRYMTSEEEKRVWKTVDENEVRYITILRDMDTGATAPGYGRWKKTRSWVNPKTKETKVYPNDPKGVEKGNSMENMAAIRSERQAFDRLYPADMPPKDIPFADEVEERKAKYPDAVETTGRVVEETHEPGGQGEESTGEVENLFPDEAPGGEASDMALGQSAVGETKLAEGMGRCKHGEFVLRDGCPKCIAERQAATHVYTPPTTQEARRLDRSMVYASAGKMKWDDKRLKKELKDRTGLENIDAIPDATLHELASKLTDLADNS